VALNGDAEMQEPRMTTPGTVVPAWRLQLAGGAAAVPYARRAAAAMLEGWGPDGRSQDVILLINELVTNAAVHGGPICLRIGPYGHSGDLYCEVVDTNPRPPRPREAARHDESGGGLMLLAAMAARHGWYPTALGKAVWFTYTRHPVGPSGPATLPPRSLEIRKLPSSALSVLEPGARWASVC
jgi:hypothetical protein